MKPEKKSPHYVKWPKSPASKQQSRNSNEDLSDAKARFSPSRLQAWREEWTSDLETMVGESVTHPARLCALCGSAGGLCVRMLSGLSFPSLSANTNISGMETRGRARGLESPAPLTPLTPTFSLPFLEFSGFTRIDGGAEAGGLGGGSLLAGVSLPSMMMELAAEWILLSLPLPRDVRAGSPVGAGLGPTSTTTVGGAPCGWWNWNC